jgi:hypothetical protein
MNEVWMLDYLNAVVLSQGVFPSEGHALGWVERNDPERASHYQAFKVEVNHKLDPAVKHTAPFRVYRNQR